MDSPVVARTPGRPKASDVSDLALLRAVVDHDYGGPFPTDAFIGIPGKVVVARQRKAQQKGYLTGWNLTQKGAQFLREADDAGEIE
jgi:hypothetical protein